MKTVFQRKKLSGWDDVEVKDLVKGETFRVLVDNVPLIKEDGGELFTALSDAFIHEGEWVVSYQ